MNEIKIDRDFVESRFYYDETSPTCLRYKIFNGAKGNFKRFPGDVAGYIESKNGYAIVAINNRAVKVHRIICVMHGLDVEGMQVDHIDGNPRNNRIENLRVVSLAENARNHKLRRTNKTGLKGVYVKTYERCGKRREHAIAKAVIPNERVAQKCVSIDLNGYQMAVALAAHWRAKTLLMINQLGAGYTERHLGFNEKARGRG